MKNIMDISHNCRVKIYPDGSRNVLVSTKPIFREKGFELYDKWDRGAKPEGEPERSTDGEHGRAKRRAKSRIFDLALSNEFSYFVTLTLDAGKVDRYDVTEVTKKLNNWLDNRVRRNGLKYVLVPELHRDGAIHFHGFFNDALSVVPSGTYALGGAKPRKPRSKAQLAEWLAAGWHEVYNLPSWSLGFTTAIELYGSKRAAVGYVCKYITKAQQKIGGRWYYSGGDLEAPLTELLDVDYGAFVGVSGSFEFVVPECGASLISLVVDGDECGKLERLCSGTDAQQLGLQP